MNERKKAILSLHFIVFLWSFTAILGDLISLSAFWLVWWRIGITCLSLFFLPNVIGPIRSLPNKLIVVYAVVGVLIAIHWITFFGAIKYANASIALVAFSLTAFMTAILEPLMTRTSIDYLDLGVGIAVVPGMMLILGELPTDGLVGFLIGLVSAFLAALFAVINKMNVTKVGAKSITLLELGSAWIFMTLCIPVAIYIQPDATMLPTGIDWIYLLILALMCTTLAFIWHLEVLKHMTAFVSNLIINLEPVYGIILAMIILDDKAELTNRFYIGVVLLMLVVAIYPLVKKRLRPTS